MCKITISPGIFFIFSKFWFFGLLVGEGGGKGNKWSPKWEKIVCWAPYLRNQASSDHNFWYTRVKWWYLQVFFPFFLIFIFQFVSGVKGQEILTVCSHHVTYAFQSEPTLNSCLHVKQLLARSRHKIWIVSDCN